MHQPTEPDVGQTVFCLNCQHNTPAAAVALATRVDLNDERNTAAVAWPCPVCGTLNHDRLNRTHPDDDELLGLLTAGGAEVTDYVAHLGDWVFDADLRTKALPLFRAQTARTLLPHLRDRAHLTLDEPAYDLVPHAAASLACWGWTA